MLSGGHRLASPRVFFLTHTLAHFLQFPAGLYGFDVRGPFLGLEIHYWAAVLDILRKKIGAEVIIRGVPG